MIDQIAKTHHDLGEENDEPSYAIGDASTT